MPQILPLPSLSAAPAAPATPSAGGGGSADASFADTLSAAQGGARPPGQSPGGAAPQGAAQSTDGAPAAAAQGGGGTSSNASTGSSPAAAGQDSASHAAAATAPAAAATATRPSAAADAKAQARTAATRDRGAAAAAPQAAAAVAQSVLGAWVAAQGATPVPARTPAGGNGDAASSGKTLPALPTLAATEDAGAKALLALQAHVPTGQLREPAIQGAQAGQPRLLQPAVVQTLVAHSATRLVADAGASTAAAQQPAGTGLSLAAGNGHDGSSAAPPPPALAALAAAPAAPVLQPTSVAPEAAATYSAALPSPVGSAPWGQELGQQMLLAVDAGTQSATLHLNPPQLGPLEIHLQLQAGQVNAQFASPHQAVRAAVQSALPQLHDLFSGAGLNLSQASVGSGSGRGQAGNAQRGGGRGQALAGAAVEGGAPVAAAPVRWLRGLVNTYV